MDAESIALPGPDVGQIAVPAKRRAFRQIDSRFVVVIVEQTQFDTLGELGNQGEVRPRAVKCGAKRIGFSWPDLNSLSEWNTYNFATAGPQAVRSLWNLTFLPGRVSIPVPHLEPV
jgi:hypothetical protein